MGLSEITCVNGTFLPLATTSKTSPRLKTESSKEIHRVSYSHSKTAHLRSILGCEPCTLVRVGEHYMSPSPYVPLGAGCSFHFTTQGKILGNDSGRTSKWMFCNMEETDVHDFTWSVHEPEVCSLSCSCLNQMEPQKTAKRKENKTKHYKYSVKQLSSSALVLQFFFHSKFHFNFDTTNSHSWYSLEENSLGETHFKKIYALIVRNMHSSTFTRFENHVLNTQLHSSKPVFQV